MSWCCSALAIILATTTTTTAVLVVVVVAAAAAGQSLSERLRKLLFELFEQFHVVTEGKGVDLRITWITICRASRDKTFVRRAET